MAVEHLKFYIINDDYILYLSKIDSKVLYNKNSKRPYVGIVIDLQNMKYFIPLSSPKLKHNSMKNSLDFHKIDGGKYGAINFCSMIPVGDNDYSLLNIQGFNQYRKNQLNDQLIWFKSNESIVLKKAKQIRDKFLDETLPNGIKKRCLDFRLLEEAALKWIRKDQ